MDPTNLKLIWGASWWCRKWAIAAVKKGEEQKLEERWGSLVGFICLPS